MQEALRGTPFIFAFQTTTTPDSATVVGPHPERPPTVRNIVSLGNNAYHVVFEPELCGVYQIVVVDGSSNILASDTIECVDALRYQRDMGVPPVHHDLVEVWPEYVNNSSGGTHDANAANGITRFFTAVNQQLVPISGYIYGISIYSLVGIADLDSVHFATIYKNGSSYRVRAISENLIDPSHSAPEEGAWSSGNGWHTIRFDKPVWAEAGDFFGIEVVNNSGATKTFLRTQEPQSYAGVSMITMVKDSALDMAGDNTLYQWSTVQEMLLIKLLIPPPDVAIGGHSIMAGHCSGADESGTYFEDHLAVYNADDDPAVMLSRMTGLRCINCAHGGSSLYQWGLTKTSQTTGYFETDVAPLHPAVMLYDSLYNDYASTVSGYAEQLATLQMWCSASGTRLIMVEAPPSMNAVTLGHAEALDTLRACVERWCELTGVQYVRTLYRLGAHSGGEEHASLRWIQRGAVGGLSGYRAFSDSYIHLTRAGRHAMATAIADQVFCGFGFVPRLVSAVSMDDTITPPSNVISESILETAENKLETNSNGYVTITNTVPTSSDIVTAIFSRSDTADNAIDTTVGGRLHRIENYTEYLQSNLMTIPGAILESPENKLATDSSGAVITDTASRNASKADVSMLATTGADGDTLETLSDQIDLIVNQGSGARTVTITINDGSDALESASVRLTKGAVSYTQRTNSSGQVTFNLDDGTYTVAISLLGYTYAGTSLVVDGDETATYSMTAITITAPSEASLCTVQFRVKLSGDAVEGAVCKAKLQGTNQASDGTILSNVEMSDTTDADGIAELQLVRKGSIVKGTGIYQVWVEIDSNPVANVTTTIPNQSTILFEDLL